MSTHSFTTSSAFTRTASAYIASKVAADLRAMRAYYGMPSESKILDYQKEMNELLPGGYVSSVQYGFKRNERKIVVLEYEHRPSGLRDDNSGRVFPRADVSGAEWFSFLTTSAKWDALHESTKKQIRLRLPFQRSEGHEPRDGDGYWTADKSYSAEGAGAQRRTFRPH